MVLLTASELFNRHGPPLAIRDQQADSPSGPVVAEAMKVVFGLSGWAHVFSAHGSEVLDTGKVLVIPAGLECSGFPLGYARTVTFYIHPEYLADQVRWLSGKHPLVHHLRRALDGESAVGRASKVVAKGVGTPEEIESARAVLSNFRSAHAFPLNAVTVTVRQRALDVNPNAVVAQRLKRLPTILDKLTRIPTMSLTTMHDLGGCRVIFETVDEVDALVTVLRDLPRARNRVTRVYDYLRADPGPKASGYRGIHLAYEYGASMPEYHGLRIELQVRTQLQHAWATAVETMDLFSDACVLVPFGHKL